MSEPWFDPNMYAWIPGAMVGIMGAVEGSLVGIFAPRGKLKKLILGLHFSVITVSIILFMVGITAFFYGQPYGIWYGFGLAGLIGTIVLGVLTPTVISRYRGAEMRRAIAEDI